MSIDPDRFRRPIIDALSRRAALLCSNPDCHAITSGPADDENRSITVGEAAHIYGAKPEAARYDPQMTAAERSAITNAIWLCRNCHKIVDASPGQFPAALLFEWRLDHERQITKKIGKTGDRLRQKVIDAELGGFEGVSYLARQIIIDKPDGWEYRLTAEILRCLLSPLLSRWQALKRGLYAKPITRVSLEESSDWIVERFTELSNLTPALSGIINDELKGALEESGSPGSILRACGLFSRLLKSGLRD